MPTGADPGFLVSYIQRCGGFALLILSLLKYPIGYLKTGGKGGSSKPSELPLDPPLANVDEISKARGLNFGLSLNLHPHFV